MLTPGNCPTIRNETTALYYTRVLVTVSKQFPMWSWLLVQTPEQTVSKIGALRGKGCLASNFTRRTCDVSTISNELPDRSAGTTPGTRTVKKTVSDGMKQTLRRIGLVI